MMYRLAPTLVLALSLSACATTNSKDTLADELSFQCKADSGENMVRSIPISDAGVSVSGFVEFGESKNIEGDQAVGVVDISGRDPSKVAKLWMQQQRSTLTGLLSNVSVFYMSVEDNTVVNEIGFFDVGSRKIPFSIEINSDGIVKVGFSEMHKRFEAAPIFPASITAGCHSLGVNYSDVKVGKRK